MELTNAEQEMIEILRHDQHVTLTITQDGAQWHIRLEDHDAGVVGDGNGPTFDLAWENTRPRT